MGNINIECLTFPSGRPVGSARKDAKKLSKLKSITLIEAQNQIAVENGLAMPWDKAIASMKANASINVIDDSILRVKSIFSRVIRELEEQTSEGNNVFAEGALRIGRVLAEHLVPVCLFGLQHLDGEGMPVLSRELIQSLMQSGNAPESLRAELAGFMESCPDEHAAALFIGYLRRAVETASTNVTFLVAAPGGGKSTILYLVLKQSMAKQGYALLLINSTTKEFGLRELPDALRESCCVAETLWNSEGHLEQIVFPDNPQKLIIIHVPKQLNSSNDLLQLVSISNELIKWDRFVKVHTVCIDEFSFLKTNYSDDESLLLQKSIEVLTSKADNKIVIASQAKRFFSVINNFKFPVRVIGSAPPDNPEIRSIKEGHSNLFENFAAITLINPLEDANPDEVIFANDSDFVLDAARLVFMRGRHLQIQGNELSRITRENLSSFTAQQRNWEVKR